MPPDTLWQAVERGNPSEVEAMLRTVADVNPRSPSGLTPLMIAVGRGDAAVTRLLLNAGADVFCVDAKAGVSVLHKACQGGNLDVVRMLVIEKGAFVDLPAATTGHTPLMDALWFKFPAIVEFLLEQGAGLNLSTHYGFTLQQHLDYERSVNFFDKERFVQAEALVNQRRAADQQKIKNNVLMDAVTKGNLDAVRSALNHRGNVDERFPVVNGFNDRHTALLVASRDGHFDIVTELLKYGADVNAVEPVFGACPLHKAVYNGHARITQLLVEQPKINLNLIGATNGYTPLHDALWHGFADCALILIRAKARLDIRGHDGKLPMDIAREVFGSASQVMAALNSS